MKNIEDRKDFCLLFKTGSHVSLGLAANFLYY